MAKKKTNSGAFEIQQRLERAMRYVRQQLPHVVGTEAVRAFKRNFQDEGFFGAKWAPRSTVRKGGTNGQKVLSQSGELGDAIEYQVQGMTVIITNDKLYAELHNEGGVLVVTPRMRRFFWAMHKQAKDAGDLTMADQWKGMALAKQLNMPQRQFIGDHVLLDKAIEQKALKDLTKILSTP